MIDIVRHTDRNECPPSLHSWTPIVEGTRTTGIVCLECGKSVREDVKVDGVLVSARGLERAVPRNRHRRKDPRF